MSYKLTKEHEDHATHITDIISDLMFKKYIAGAKEHQSKLWEFTPLQLAYEIRQEAIDQAVYAQTLIDQLEKREFNPDMTLDEYKELSK